jgi:hypothetical protein
MPRLELTLEDQLMNDLTAMALKQRVSSETLCLEVLKRYISSSKIDNEDPGKDGYERYINSAINRIKSLNSGTKFSLNGNHRDSIRLFTKDEWTIMNNQDGFVPNRFGKYFAQCVNNHKDLKEIVEPSDKGSDNKQRYIRR